jgi:hypothetical protein
MKARLFAAAAGAVLSIGLWAAPAPAQGTGGAGTARRDGSPSRPAALYSPGVIEGVVRGALDKNRGLYEGKFKEILSQRDLVARGVTLYDISVRLGGSAQVQAQPGKDCVLLDCAVTDNRLECAATLPSIRFGPFSFRLGKFADPRFDVRFDLRLLLTLTAANGLGPPAVTSATLEATNLQIKPTNTSARVVKAVDSVVNSFSRNLFGKKLLLQALEGGLKVDCTNALSAGW